MTTHDTIPTPPPPALAVVPTNTASLPTTAPAPPRAILDPQALLRAAIDAAGLDGGDLNDLRIVQKYAVGETIWLVNEKPPGRDDMLVIAIFDGSAADTNDTYVPGDVRAYVMPLGAGAPQDKKWFCYTLSRANPLASTAAGMHQDRFIEEVALELSALAGVRDAVAEENEALRDVLEKIVVKAAETTTPAVQRLVSIGELAAEALADEEEEEEEDGDG
jgi:hypothetical protein